MSFRPARNEFAPEQLDLLGHERSVYERSLSRVFAANRWLGGNRALWNALAPLLPRSGTVRFLDAGTGSGQIPLLLAQRIRQRSLEPHIVATDLHPDAVAVAHGRTRVDDAVHVARADVRCLPFADGSFDFTCMTLTLHHLRDDDALLALRELARVARRAVLVGELERAWAHYIGARALAATLWVTDAITKRDGPVSVLRGYTADELLACAHRAGLTRVRVERHVFYRLLLVASVT